MPHFTIIDLRGVAEVAMAAITRVRINRYLSFYRIHPMLWQSSMEPRQLQLQWRPPQLAELHSCLKIDQGTQFPIQAVMLLKPCPTQIFSLWLPSYHFVIPATFAEAALSCITGASKFQLFPASRLFTFASVLPTCVPFLSYRLIST